MLDEKTNDAVENLLIRQRMTTFFAIENDNRHAPYPLARDAPVGARRDHVRNTVVAPGRNPAYLANGVQRLLPQTVVLHPDEPLFGSAEDGGIMAAPAVRIRVVDILRRKQRAMLFQDFNHQRIAFPNRLAEELRGDLSGHTLRLKKASRRVHRTIHRQTVPHPANVIFVSVPGGRVNRAGALFERDMIAQHSDRIAVEERVPEGSAFELAAMETRDNRR